MVTNKNRRKIPKLTADTVGGIFEPSFAVPTIGGPSVKVSTIVPLENMLFYIPPLQYLSRMSIYHFDFHADEIRGKLQHETVRTDKDALKYFRLRDDKAAKKGLWDDLLAGLATNIANSDDSASEEDSDEELIAGLAANIANSDDSASEEDTDGESC